MSQPAFDVEEALSRHLSIVPQVKQAYDKVLGEVFADLSATDLAPFAEIHAQHEETYLDTEKLMEEMRVRMTEVLKRANEHVFDSNDVDHKLVILEVLKEKFNSYEGTQWNVHNISPLEHTRPIRMLYINSSIRFMERQLKAQEQELQVALAKRQDSCERLQQLQNERVKCNSIMDQQLAHYKEVTPKLKQMQEEIDDIV